MATTSEAEGGEHLTYLQGVGLGRGMIFAQIGADGIERTLAVGRSLHGVGNVFAVVLDESATATTRAAIDGAGLTGWVIPITATPSSLPIPDGAVDLVHLDHVVSRHDLGDAFLAEVGRVLRAKGRLAVLDWEEVAADALVAGHGPPPGARVSAEQARSLIEGAGFAFAESVPAPEGRYAMVFDRS